MKTLSLMFAAVTLLCGQNVLYKPYIQLGGARNFKAKDQMVIAWQTDEAKPNNNAYAVDYGTSVSYGNTTNPKARTVDNYLTADTSLPVPPTVPGARANYDGGSIPIEPSGPRNGRGAQAPVPANPRL
jgi:hypothetical protein